MKKITLKARIRKEASKKNVHKLRQEGEIPGVVYGHKKDPVHLAIPEHDFWTVLHNATSEHLIIDLDVDGLDMEDHISLVREIQHHPVSGDILHVDFQRIRMDESIKVGIPVVLTGIARGVKEFGGVLDHGIREVMVATTAATVPENLEIDVSELMINDSIHVSDLEALYPNIEFLDDSGLNIAHVSPPKKLEVLEEAEEGAEAAAEGEEAEGEEAGEEGSEEGGEEA
jgi:large subunit ribosomal protein L25